MIDSVATHQMRSSNSLLPSDLPSDSLDRILAWQLTIAWAGEGNGELQRLGWWRTDLTDELGGGDFFQRLLPKTGRWAAFEAVREAAIRCDRKSRERLSISDSINTLFFWGFAIDEQLTDRLAEHKRGHKGINEALALHVDIDTPFNQQNFEAALKAASKTSYEVVPEGRRIRADKLPSFEMRTHQLVDALLPLSESYPMPFYSIEAQ